MYKGSLRLGHSTFVFRKWNLIRYTFWDNYNNCFVILDCLWSLDPDLVCVMCGKWLRIIDQIELPLFDTTMSANHSYMFLDQSLMCNWIWMIGFYLICIWNTIWPGSWGSPWVKSPKSWPRLFVFCPVQGIILLYFDLIPSTILGLMTAVLVFTPFRIR